MTAYPDQLDRAFLFLSIVPFRLLAKVSTHAYRDHAEKKLCSMLRSAKMKCTCAHSLDDRSKG